MEINTIIAIITGIITFICGLIAKKSKWFNNRLIPVQNLAIGVIAGMIYYHMTKDIDLVIITIGLGTGGTYDLVKNLLILFKGE